MRIAVAVALLLAVVLPASAPDRHSAAAATLGDGLAVSGDFKGVGRAQIVSFYDTSDDLSLRAVVLDRTGTTDTFAHEQWLIWGASSFDLGRAKLAATDVDRDGKTDVVALYEDGPTAVRLLVFRSTGTAFTYLGAWWQSAGYAFSRVKAILPGNFSAVGNTGLLLAYQYDDFQMRVHYLESDRQRFIYGGDGGVYDSGPGQYDTARARFAIGHFTRSGGPEQIASIYQYPNFRIRTHVFDPSPSGLVPVNGWAGVYDSGEGQFDLGRMKIAAADVDGDGRTDIGSLYSYPDGSTRVQLFSGAASLAPVSGSGGIGYTAPGLLDWSALRLVGGDWNGDRRGDLATLEPRVDGTTHAAMLLSLSGRTTPELALKPDAWVTPAGEVQPLHCTSCWPLLGTPLNGGPVNRRALNVRIDNSPSARPHYGTSEADMVFELEVEGGITRYSAIFHSKDPGTIGSIRSARLSDRYITPMVRGAVAYSGATIEETEILRNDAAAGAFIDLNATLGRGGYYRVSYRSSPFNMFASSASLRDGVNQAGGGAPVSIPLWGFIRNPNHTATAGGFSGSVTANSLTIPYRSDARVVYQYDAASRSYARYQAGVREVDAANDVAIAAKNVVAIYTDIWETNIIQDIFNSRGVDMRLAGSGAATIFRGGRRQEGTWSRGTDVDAFSFSSNGGERILLSPGQTWVHVIRKQWTVTSE